jgi:riboflavin synthase
MFTGIIESTGLVYNITESGTNRTFIIESELAKELKVDQSLAHNGVCLTVESVQENRYQVTAVQETLNKTTLGLWKKNNILNLERCLRLNGRLDGHLVQGHVDTTGICLSKKDLNGSWEFRFSFPDEFSSLLIEKGSISLDGISLTIFNLHKSAFSVAVIPYTFAHTNLRYLKEGDLVNLEFDMIGKYVRRHFQLAGS